MILYVDVSDVRPGLVSQNVARQYKNEARHREMNLVNRHQNKPRHQLENEQRDEGLKNALTADNKGFKLMEKMGYKPGTAIGKKGEKILHLAGTSTLCLVDTSFVFCCFCMTDDIIM